MLKLANRIRHIFPNFLSSKAQSCIYYRCGRDCHCGRSVIRQCMAGRLIQSVTFICNSCHLPGIYMSTVSHKGYILFLKIRCFSFFILPHCQNLFSSFIDPESIRSQAVQKVLPLSAFVGICVKDFRRPAAGREQGSHCA